MEKVSLHTLRHGDCFVYGPHVYKVLMQTLGRNFFCITKGYCIGISEDAKVVKLDCDYEKI